MTKLLNGNQVAMKIRKEISNEIVKKIVNKKQRVPHLGIILVGENHSSRIYVNSKIQECKKIGMQSTLIHLHKNIEEKKILEIINNMNNNPMIDGFIIQLPIEKHLNQEKIISSINPKKDVDGFHPENFGKISLKNTKSFFPATALGIITLLERNNINIHGKHTVIIGRSRIVGLPTSLLMSRKATFGNSTVTIAHSYTKDLSFYTKHADIIIIAVGIPNFLKGKMIKKGVILVDVGINNIHNSKKLLGDIDFDSVNGIASYISPVPGGVGPMTRVMLLKNTLHAALHYRIK
ncbi:bifunctional 5,10-methylenetetrahydrofolate dehydrogenase/5,10-methenyltetrahydrofolate cyclohydrolase [Blattabacterium cuenoti]|uniref:bifunctional 5,10-methylenetetrahydrofolate dehydrogenase/5,10-methenyltetrahydrofolate cyclohydrolase n=1 Tax=Blattabacterium cuenoti TaxID=1653831 RepID=UPI00163CD7AC|nr:bifunctional 5,10-methylenetetrahydrofolate dehydrogenase/5,10-methenyltetrahydrofolate cyclohydrolase [Blattabacterium cuenoti]